MSLGTLLHRKIFLAIMDDIRTGKYVDGDALPSEDVLANQFKVSRVTVRRALLDLVQAGTVVRQQGRGTFVKKVGPSAQVFPVRQLKDHIVKSGKLKVTIEECTYVVPNPHIAQALKLKPGQQAQRIVRVRHDGRTPVLHLTTYLPDDIGRAIKIEDLAERPLYEILSDMNLAYDHAEQSVGACLADPFVAALLKVEVGEALLHIHRVLRSANRPIEFLEIRASPKQYQLVLSWDLSEDKEDMKPSNIQYSTTIR